MLRPDIDRLRGRMEVNTGFATDAHHRLRRRRLRAVLADDPTRALELAVAAALLSTYGADSGTSLDTTAPATTDAINNQIINGARPRTRCLGHHLLALGGAATQDWAPALTSLHDALAVGADLDGLSHLGNTALHLGDHDAHHRSITALVAGARNVGAGMLVLYALPGSASARSSPADGLPCVPTPSRRSPSAPAPGNRRSALPHSAGSPSWPLSMAQAPSSRTGSGQSSTGRRGDRSVCPPTPCTTSPAGHRAPWQPTPTMPGLHCTTSARSASAPSGT